MSQYILAIDQGTTNSRALIFDRTGAMISKHEEKLQQCFPHPGWVEQDAEALVKNTVICCQQAIQKANLTAHDIAAIGISNQRETTILWDKATGKPIGHAIVWQDRRTSGLCEQLAHAGLNPMIGEKTGLLLDPYFSATKIHWLLEHTTGARARAEAGELLFGTVETYLIWHFTGGQSHVTDITNASRTLLFNIRTLTWDEDLLKLFNIPHAMLPAVLDNVAHFGDVAPHILGGRIPIGGVAGDQQAALIGQACFHPGMVKATYGTGSFMLLNTGTTLVTSDKHLLSTIAYRINGELCYGLEGSIFAAGTIVKWLRDALHLITTAAESESLARSIPNTGGVYLVPAFTGLGAPYWDPHARGSILGLTYQSDRAHIVRAGLESVGYQTRDLLDAMGHHVTSLKALRVDGGMVMNNWLVQFIADMLNITVQRSAMIEASCMGAAYLAGLYAGFYHSLDEIAELWQVACEFKSQMSATDRDKLYAGWQAAVKKVM